MPPLLILTVGTGTAGRHSDVAQGLANTIRQVRPRKFWRLPSARPDSVKLANLVRNGPPMPATPWTGVASGARRPNC